jgi:hypothetical protein
MYLKSELKGCELLTDMLSFELFSEPASCQQQFWVSGGEKYFLLLFFLETFKDDSGYANESASDSWTRVCRTHGVVSRPHANISAKTE